MGADKVPPMEVVKKHGVSGGTLYTWRNRFGGISWRFSDPDAPATRADQGGLIDALAARTKVSHSQAESVVSQTRTAHVLEVIETAPTTRKSFRVCSRPEPSPRGRVRRMSVPV
jgi:hypothetical protein